MEKDKTLEALFLAQKPTFDDSADFMAALTKRLNAVEYIKQHQEATIRRYKMAMVLALVVGIISGGVSIALVLSTPVDVPLFDFQFQNAFLAWLVDNSRVFAATILSLLMTLGIVNIFNNIQDIRLMQQGVEREA